MNKHVLRNDWIKSLPSLFKDMDTLLTQSTKNWSKSRWKHLQKQFTTFSFNLNPGLCLTVLFTYPFTDLFIGDVQVFLKLRASSRQLEPEKFRLISGEVIPRSFSPVNTA